MGSVLKNLFGLLTGRRAAEVRVALFGKHPGWDDHVEIGLDTDLLADVRQSLYVEGIAGNIDNGAWDKLPADRRFSFDHAMYWQRDRELVAGRFWSSRDGKGRDRYPLVACAQCSGLPRDWVVNVCMPAIESLRATCQETTSAEQVVAAVAQTQGLLRQAVKSLAKQHTVAALPGKLQNHPALGSDGRALLTVQYHVDRAGPDADVHIRVPLCAESFEQSIELWSGLLRTTLGQQTPVLALHHLNDNWIDLLCGRPQLNGLYCILADRTAMPLTTEIPYQLDAEFVARQQAEDK